MRFSVRPTAQHTQALDTQSDEHQRRAGGGALADMCAARGVIVVRLL